MGRINLGQKEVGDNDHYLFEHGESIMFDCWVPDPSWDGQVYNQRRSIQNTGGTNSITPYINIYGDVTKICKHMSNMLNDPARIEKLEKEMQETQNYIYTYCFHRTYIGIEMTRCKFERLFPKNIQLLARIEIDSAHKDCSDSEKQKIADTEFVEKAELPKLSVHWFRKVFIKNLLKNRIMYSKQPKGKSFKTLKPVKKIGHWGVTYNYKLKEFYLVGQFLT